MNLYNIILSYFSQFLSTYQLGFSPRRSTCTNLVEFTNFVHSRVNDGCQVDVIYTDMLKAVDKVDWIILLHKMLNIGKPNCIIGLIKSYLSDRKCYVHVNGVLSAPYSSSSGVPQGSNLGPLLFNVFINDLPEHLSCYSLMYADDVKLFIPTRTIHDCILLQNNIDEILLW